jgi:RNA polymerase sigma-70 factor (ECF subfamily)
MQETYVSAFYKLSQFEHRASFKTWLTRILLNHCFHKRTKASFSKELFIADEIVDSTIPQFSTPAKNENSVMNKELRHVIEAALAKLPLEYRMVFSLRELSSFSVAETAITLNISENNVRSVEPGKIHASENTKTYSATDISNSILSTASGRPSDVDQIND